MRDSCSPLTKQIVEGMIEGKRKIGWQRTQRYDNIREWTGSSYNKAKRKAQTEQHGEVIVSEVLSSRAQKWSPIVKNDGGSKVARQVTLPPTPRSNSPHTHQDT